MPETAKCNWYGLHFWCVTNEVSKMCQSVTLWQPYPFDKMSGIHWIRGTYCSLVKVNWRLWRKPHLYSWWNTKPQARNLHEAGNKQCLLSTSRRTGRKGEFHEPIGKTKRKTKNTHTARNNVAWLVTRGAVLHCAHAWVWPSRFSPALSQFGASNRTLFTWHSNFLRRAFC